MTVTVDFSKGLVPVILQHYVTEQSINARVYERRSI